MSDRLKEFLSDSLAEAERRTAHLPKPIASVWVSIEGQSIDVCLDGSADYHSEWIKGEGADIGLHRKFDDNKVAGAHLPLYAKTLIVSGSNFGTVTIDLTTGKVTLEEPCDKT